LLNKYQTPSTIALGVYSEIGNSKQDDGNLTIPQYIKITILQMQNLYNLFLCGTKVYGVKSELESNLAALNRQLEAQKESFVEQ
jgi:hypothetical protein